jgi:hypothetical protein
LTPQNAQEVHKTLVQIFQYAEGILLPQATAPQQRAPSPVASKNPVKEEEFEEDDLQEPNQAEEFVVSDAPEEDGDPVLDQSDFPVLGTEVEQKREPKEQMRSQKREPGDKKKKWVKLEGTETGIVIGDDPNVPRSERYNGLMRKHEKELIAKIQISQLVTDEPLVDDYYFQMYKLREESKPEEMAPQKSSDKKGKKSKKWLQSSEQFVGKSSGTVISNQMQQQMKRLIESRRSTKPRETSVTLEGALGTIGKKTAKKPKQAIALPTSTHSAPVTGKTSRIVILKLIEKIYSGILKFEAQERKKTEKMDEDELEQ